MEKNANENNVLEKNPEEISEETKAIKTLREIYLQNQWEIISSPSITIIPSPIYTTPMRSFTPNSYIYISTESELNTHWPEISQQTILGKIIQFSLQITKNVNKNRCGY